MPEIIYTVAGLLMIALLASGLVWLMVRSLKRAEDPARLIVKWIGTALVAGVLVGILGGFGPSVGSAFVVPVICVVLGITLSLIWAPSIAALMARPITALFDGGMEEAQPEPLYSTAEARRKQGRPREALWEIQQQLQQFPGDFTGEMTTAEIQAEDLKDLEAAQATIHRLCEQEGRAPAHLALALNRLADWQLEMAQDLEAARASLQQIIERLPDSPWAYAASQRLAHLGSTQTLLAPHDRQPIPLPASAPDAAFPPKPPAAAPEPSAENAARDIVKHLEAFPEDNEAREQLAALYARHYRRLDLARLELEQLIAQPNAPGRQIAHWLNLLASWQVDVGRDEEGARQTLQRLADTFPNLAAGQLARQRLDHLKLEMKKAEAARSVHLGTYEQDLGLKMKGPPSPGGRPRPAQS